MERRAATSAFVAIMRRQSMLASEPNRMLAAKQTVCFYSSHCITICTTGTRTAVAMAAFVSAQRASHGALSRRRQHEARRDQTRP